MSQKTTRIDYGALMNGKGCRYGRCQVYCDQPCLIWEEAYEGRGAAWIEVYLAEANSNDSSEE